MKTILTVLLSLPVLLATAQKSEYIVTFRGDTINGPYNLSGNVIEVSVSATEKKNFPADDVKEVYNGSSLSQVLHFPLRTYSDNIETVQSTSYKDEVYDTTMFLKEVYNTPKMNLYFAVDKNKVQYYFVKRPEDKVPQQLMVSYSIVRPYKDDSRPGYTYSMLNQQRFYINQLKGLMDCDPVSEETWNLMDYRVYSFKKIIKLYNKKCK